MKFITSNNVSISDVPDFDLVIASSGYEERSTVISSKLKDKIEKSKKICCAFLSNTTNKQRKNNDTIFKKLDFEILVGDGNDDLFIEKLLEDIIEQYTSKKNILNVLVDYSSMTRLWYAAILRFFYYNQTSLTIHLYFAYSFAKYQPPAKSIFPNIHVNPIEGYSEFSLPDKPTALIIGMGYEAERAYGLTEYFDAETFLFYNDSTGAEQFSKDVEKINNELINTIPSDRIYKYPINNLEYLERILFDLCQSLNTRYRVVIAPCGPKPFALISLLISLRFNNVDVWRISAGDVGNKMIRNANGEISIYRAILSNKLLP